MVLIGLSAAAQVAKADVSVDFFYNNLSGGNWIEVGDYGYCWQPDVAVSSSDWRPYADGYWAYTDEGWTWVSYEDFGWATYHYGRWAHLSDAGWVWVPGRDQDMEWGPAWVSWRTGGDYVGWAPLPPTGERVYEGRDISGHVDVDFDIGPDYYNFVDVRYIGEPVLRERIIARGQNVNYINQTVNVTNITYKNKVVYNYGPDINVINQRASRPIQRLTIQRDNNADFSTMARSGGLKTKVQGQSLVVAAPAHIARSTQQIAPPTVKTRVAKANLDTGWAGVGDAKAKEQFKQKLRSEDATKVPQGTGAAASGRAATAASPAGANANAQLGASPASGSPAASAAAGINARAGGGGKHDRNQAASVAASAPPAVATSPAQPGVAGSTDANAGLERGKGGKNRNRQGELNAAGSATGAAPAAESATGGSTPDTSGQERGRHNGRRGDQLPSSSAGSNSGLITTPGTTAAEGAGQGGGKHNRRDQNSAAAPEGQLQGQPPAGADQSQGQGGRRERRLERQGASTPEGELQGQPPTGADQSQGQDSRRERRLERQGASTPNPAVSGDAQAPGAGSGLSRGQGQGQPSVSGQPPGAAPAEQGQGQGRHEGANRKNRVEASPVPSPQ